MKNKSLLAAVLISVAVPSVHADVEALYWQVTGENNPDPISFTAAAFAAKNGGTTEYLKDSLGNEWQAANADGATTASIASLWDDKYSGEGWSFYIELQNWDGAAWTTVGTIGDYTYDQIKDHIVSSSSMSMSMVTPLTSGTAHIPEPTSGLLMLVGGALLALRRRRV